MQLHTLAEEKKPKIMKLISRNNIFNWVIKENPDIDLIDLESVFKQIEDETLADIYGLMILRKGYFIR